MKLLITVAMIILLCGPYVWAGCEEDCRDEHESAVQSCKEQYDDPDDAGALQVCMDDAKADLDSCINDCED